METESLGVLQVCFPSINSGTFPGDKALTKGLQLQAKIKLWFLSDALLCQQPGDSWPSCHTVKSSWAAGGLRVSLNKSVASMVCRVPHSLPSLYLENSHDRFSSGEAGFAFFFFRKLSISAFWRRSPFLPFTMRQSFKNTWAFPKDTNLLYLPASSSLQWQQGLGYPL